jgi:hypothetical protein
MSIQRSRSCAVLLAALMSAPVHAACTFGTSNETSLQGVFDNVLGTGVLSATNDCLASSAAAVWTAPGQVVATIIIEIAGFSGDNSFGIYDPSQPSRQATLFVGSDNMGATQTVQLVGNGAGFDVMVGGSTTPSASFASNSFGYFLHTPQNNTFFSQATLNADSADHMYSYQGNGASFVGAPPSLIGTSFATSMYLLAFEDLLMSQSDRDYQDFVALVNYASPIPIPAGIWLLGSALAALGAWQARGHGARLQRFRGSIPV